MATEGPNEPTAATDLAVGGSWTNLANAKHPDGNEAVGLLGISTAIGIKLTGFSFSAISGNATALTGNLYISGAGNN